jgi:hypothetical protein
MMNDEEKQPTITTVLSVVVVATIIMINIDFFFKMEITVSYSGVIAAIAQIV